MHTKWIYNKMRGKWVQNKVIFRWELYLVQKNKHRLWSWRSVQSEKVLWDPARSEARNKELPYVVLDRKAKLFCSRNALALTLQLPSFWRHSPGFPCSQEGGSVPCPPCASSLNAAPSLLPLLLACSCSPPLNTSDLIWENLIEHLLTWVTCDPFISAHPDLTTMALSYLLIVWWTYIFFSAFWFLLLFSQPSHTGMYST